MYWQLSLVVLLSVVLSSCASLSLSTAKQQIQPKPAERPFVVETSAHLSLDNKVAIVIGASSGIGKEIAKTFAKANARVVLFARREELLKQNVHEITDAGGQAIYVVGDAYHFAY